MSEIEQVRMQARENFRLFQESQDRVRELEAELARVDDLRRSAEGDAQACRAELEVCYAADERLKAEVAARDARLESLGDLAEKQHRFYLKAYEEEGFVTLSVAAIYALAEIEAIRDEATGRGGDGG